MKPKTTKMVGMGVLLLFLAGAAAVTAEHVEPTVIDHEDNNNPTCADFGDWTEFKIEDPESGDYSDGTLDVTLVVTNDDEGEPMSFDWTSNIGVSAIVVKDGSHDHHLYEYDPAAMADTGLTAGEHDSKEGKFGAISHISFCYMEEDGEEPPNGNETPPPDGNETPPPVFDDCPPGSLAATANSDSSITVTVSDLTANATLMRSDGGDFVEVASFNATSDTYVDTDTEVGVTYTYQLVIDGDVCDQIEVTAIPVFPGLIGAVLATGLGVLGYVGLRRRS